jgi:raffinose/stachyose/melibiose transport system substrate-binding protein
MKQRTAILTAVAVVSAAALALAGCAPSGDGDTPTKTLSVLVWDNGASSIAAYKAVAEGFEDATPGVTVNIETANTNDYQNLLKTRLSGGKGPDVYGVQPNMTPDLVTGEYLVDVTGESWLAPIKEIAEGAPNAAQDGGIYSFPIAKAADGIVYNTALFAQAGITEKPETYSELLDAAEALSAAGVVPFAMSAGDNWWPQFILYHLTAQLVSHANPGINAQLMDGSATFSDSPEWRAVMEQYLELVPYFMPDPVGTTQSAAQAAFLQGQAAMFPAAWILADVRSADFDVDYFNFPATDEADVSSIWGGYPVQLGINPQNGNEDLASDFVEYLFSADVYSDFLSGLGSYPVVEGVELENADPLVPTLLEAWEGKKFEASPPDTWLPGVQDAMLTSVQELTGGRVTVDEVLAAMDAATELARK